MPVIADGPRLARTRLPWSVAVLLAALLTFVVGMTFVALSATYDLRHWDAVTAPSQATYTIDDHGVGIAVLWYTSVASVVLPVLTVIALAFLTWAMLRGSRAAWGLTSGLICSYLFCCGTLLAASTAGSADDGSVVTTVHDQTTPILVRVAGSSCGYLVVVGEVLAAVMLFVPPTRRALRRRSESRPGLAREL